MSLVCDICGSSLSTKRTLKLHKETAKRCLLLQQKKCASDTDSIDISSKLDNIHRSKPERIDCQLCPKNIAKSKYKRHMMACKKFDPKKHVYVNGVVLNINNKTPASRADTPADTVDEEKRVFLQQNRELDEEKHKLREEKYIHLEERLKHMEEKLKLSEDTVQKQKKHIIALEKVIKDQSAAVKAIHKLEQKKKYKYIRESLNLDKTNYEKIVNARYDLRYTKEGEIGIANFFFDEILKNRATGDVNTICYDKKDTALKYMDNLGNIISDVNGLFLLHFLNKYLMPFILLKSASLKCEISPDDQDLTDVAVEETLTGAFINQLIHRLIFLGKESKTEMDEKLVVSKTRKQITKKDRTDVWNFYIGAKYGTHKCLLCTFKTIDKGLGDWHCGHVVPHSAGGKTMLENLRPICADCNMSMSDMNMREYCFIRHNTDAIERLQLSKSPLINKTDE